MCRKAVRDPSRPNGARDLAHGQGDSVDRHGAAALWVNRQGYRIKLVYVCFCNFTKLSVFSSTAVFMGKNEQSSKTGQAKFAVLRRGNSKMTIQHAADNAWLVVDNIDDPRTGHCDCSLREILFVAAVAYLCDAESHEDIATFGSSSQNKSRHQTACGRWYLGFPAALIVNLGKL